MLMWVVVIGKFSYVEMHQTILLRFVYFTVLNHTSKDIEILTPGPIPDQLSQNLIYKQG